MEKLRVAVLMGGPSSEHEVSLKSGGVVLAHLDPKKYDAVPIMITKEGMWRVPDGTELLERDALQFLAYQSIGLAFIAMHGEYGEDGTIQALLDSVNMPYTCSNAQASRLAMDKRRSSELLRALGVRVPRSDYFLRADWEHNEGMVRARVREIGFPAVVKPVDLGSSVGVTIVKDKERIKDAMRLAFSRTAHVMAQEYIKGDEVTCGVLDENGRAIALPPTQIIPRTSPFFDYEAKYQPDASEEITPPRLPAGIIAKIGELALLAHHTLGASGMSRTDMIVRDGEVFYLETNTIPGMTATSLYPQAAKAAGIALPELFDRLIKNGLRRAKPKPEPKPLMRTESSHEDGG